MDKKTALITGGAGYLGSHLAKSLKKDGWKVVGLGHKRTTLNPYIDIMHYGDIRDQDALDWLFDKVKVDVVFHLAGRIEAGISFQEPTEFWSVNCGGTTILLNAMHKAGVKNIVFSSTAAVYKAQNRPILEYDEKTDNSPYGFSKLSAENAIRHSGLNFTIFRYFNLTGADPDGEFGESHEPETHLIPRLLLDMDNIEINGTDYDTPDGTCVRDYVHVTDVADAHSKAGKMLLDGEYSGVTMNLGTGKGTSILDVIKALEKITNKTITYKVNQRRDGDAASLIADINLAKEVLQYEPKYDMMTMIQTAYNWYKNDEKI
jgi:UDP-glucose-4-epimerase GalE